MGNIELSKNKIAKPTARGSMNDYADNPNPLDYAWALGGMGGCGGGVVQAGIDRYSWIYDESPFSVKTLLALVRSTLHLFSGATYDAGCDIYIPNAGSEVALYVGVSEDGNLTDAEIIAQTTAMGGPWIRDGSEWNLDISKFVIQPNNVLWSKKIYVTVAWFNANYWWYGLTDVNFYKIDYEEGF